MLVSAKQPRLWLGKLTSIQNEIEQLFEQLPRNTLHCIYPDNSPEVTPPSLFWHYPFLNLFRVLKMTNTNIQASQAAPDRPVRRGEVVMSSFHGSKISWSCKYGEKKKKRKNRHVWLSCAWYIVKNKTVGHTFLLSFDNTNGHFCQDRLLRSRNLATMVTWRHTSLCCF